MKQISAETFMSLVTALSGLLALLTIAWVVLRKLRGNTQQNEDTAGEFLSNLQELRREGDISDAEYRTIKAVLGAQLQQRVKDDQDKG
jgi:uncharacterized membrane protein